MKKVSKRKLTAKELENQKQFIRQILIDRKFLSSYTDEEFLKYESKRLDVNENLIRKIMIECGYFSNKPKKVYRDTLSSYSDLTGINFANVEKLS